MHLTISARTRRTFVIIGAVLVLIAPLSAHAAAGLTPASRWYFLDVAFERVALALTWSPVKKAQRAIAYAEEKVEETRVLAAAGDVQRVARAQANVERYTVVAVVAVERIAERSSDAAHVVETEGLRDAVREVSQAYLEAIAVVASLPASEDAPAPQPVERSAEAERIVALAARADAAVQRASERATAVPGEAVAEVPRVPEEAPVGTPLAAPDAVPDSAVADVSAAPSDADVAERAPEQDVVRDSMRVLPTEIRAPTLPVIVSERVAEVPLVIPERTVDLTPSIAPPAPADSAPSSVAATAPAVVAVLPQSVSASAASAPLPRRGFFGRLLDRAIGGGTQPQPTPAAAPVSASATCDPACGANEVCVGTAGLDATTAQEVTRYECRVQACPGYSDDPLCGGACGANARCVRDAEATARHIAFPSATCYQCVDACAPGEFASYDQCASACPNGAVTTRTGDLGLLCCACGVASVDSRPLGSGDEAERAQPAQCPTGQFRDDATCGASSCADSEICTRDAVTSGQLGDASGSSCFACVPACKAGNFASRDRCERACGDRARADASDPIGGAGCCTCDPLPDAAAQPIVSDGDAETVTTTPAEDPVASVIADLPAYAPPEPAPLPAGPPDLVLESHELTDNRLIVVFRNATAQPIADARFDVGFQWVDDRGDAVGAKRYASFTKLGGNTAHVLDSVGATVLHDVGLFFKKPQQALLTDYLHERPDGATGFRITVDDGDRIPEAREENNAVILRIARPDLTIVRPSISGSRLLLTYTNASDARIAAAFAMSVQWLRADGKPAADACYLSLSDMDANAAQALDSETTACATESGILVRRAHPQQLSAYLAARPNDAARLRIAMDADGAITESDEANNVVTLEIPRPDLAVVDAAFAPGGSASRGFTMTFRNASTTTPIAERFEVGFQWLDASGNALDAPRAAVFTRMGPSETLTVTEEQTMVAYRNGVLRTERTEPLASSLTNLRPDGAARLRVTLDSSASIAEADEGNNRAELDAPPLPPPPPPPPAPADIIITNAVLGADRVRFDVQNIGDGATSMSSITVDFVWRTERRAEIGEHYRVTIGAIAAHDTFAFDSTGVQASYDSRSGFWRRLTTATVPLTDVLRVPPREATHLSVTVDPARLVRETNTGNNAVLLERTRANLVIADAAFDGARLTFAVRNAGAGHTGGEFTVGLSWWDRDGSEIVWARRAMRLAALAPGAVRAVDAATIPLATVDANGRLQLATDTFARLLQFKPDTAATLRLTVDAQNEIPETNEEENQVTLPLPLPDLVVVSVVRVDDPPRNDRLMATFANIGAMRAITLVTFQWEDARGAAVGNPMHVGQLGFLEPGQRVVREYRYDGYDSIAAYLRAPPAGAVSIRVALDGLGRIAEGDETNNSVTLDARRRQADLTLSDAALRGGRLTFEYGNIGTAPVAAANTVVLWFEFRTPWDSRAGSLYRYEVGPIAPSARAQFDSARTPLTYDLYTAAGLTAQQETLGEVLRDPPADAVRLRITLDGPRTIPELSEENNSVELDLEVLPKPNLVLQREALAMDALSADIFNLGHASVPAFVVQFEWLDGSSTRVGAPARTTLEALRPRNGRTQTFRSGDGVVGALLARPPEGAVRLRVTLDPDGSIAEEDESDNFVLIARPDPAILPDLVFVELKMHETIAGLGHLFMTNRGKSASPMYRWATQWVDAQGKRIGTAHVERGIAMPPGYGYNFGMYLKDTGGMQGVFDTFFRNRPTGAMKIRFTIDDAGEVTEADETNNTYDVVPPDMRLPDLAITSVRVDAATAQLFIEFKNAGVAETPEFPWIVAWRDASGKRIGETYRNRHAVLAAGLAATMSSASTDTFGAFLAAPPDGAVGIEVIADPDGVIAESNDANNAATFDGWPLPKPKPLPDLTFNNGRLFLSDWEPRVFVVGVKNAGEAVTGAVTWEMHWLDGTGAVVGARYRATHPGLPPGSTYPAQSDADDRYAQGTKFPEFVKTPPAGAAMLEVVLDPDDAIAEAREDNNRDTMAAAALAVLVKPANKPPTADAGEDIAIRDADSNGTEAALLSGAGSSDPDGTVASWVWTVNGRGVANGKSVRWGAPLGEHTVVLTVTDNAGATATDSVKVTVAPREAEPEPEPEPEPELPKPPEERVGPDLIVISVVASPASPRADDRISFTATVRNAGTAAASASSAWLSMDLDRDGIPDALPSTESLDGLAPGAFGTLSWTDAWEATAGAHAFEVCLDINLEVTESNDENNCKELVLTVGNPAVTPLPTRVAGALRPLGSLLGAIFGATPIRASADDGGR